ncbi:MAG: PAS domain S-box protein [Verrucomicrobia bacterium]|nr:PAS domain S-box protein [Verrucomicrobiota bacterium]
MNSVDVDSTRPNAEPVPPANVAGKTIGESVDRMALRVSLGYAILGALWILFSDTLLTSLISDRKIFEWVSIAKGWGFIAVTAMLFYGALRTQLRQVRTEWEARRAASEALATREAQLSAALHLVTAGHWEFDLMTRKLRCNDHLYRVLRTTAQREGGYEMTAERFVSGFMAAEDAGLLDAEIERARAAQGPTYVREFQHQVKFGDGAPGFLHTRIFARKGETGQTTIVQGVTVDYTRQHTAEAALRNSEARFRAMFENSLDGLLLTDPNTDRVLAANAAACRMFRLSEEGLCRAESDRLMAPDDPRSAELLRERRRLGRAKGQLTLVRGDGTRFEGDVASHVFATAEGMRGTMVIHDLTARRHAAESLRRSEQAARILSRAIEQSPVSIVITDPQGHIEYVNPRFTEVSGYARDEVLGKNPRILKSGRTPPETYESLWATITAGREWHGELCNRRKDGEQVWEHVSVSPVLDDAGRIAHFVAVKEDITERRSLEEQLRRSQRLEAIGALSSGIAHDLNNILAPMLMAPALLRESLPAESDRNILVLIEQSARRGADIVKQLLTFSRGSGGERVPIQVRHLLKDMRAIVMETFPREITPVFDVASNVLLVLGDATQLHQVLLNLCVNARDAMPGGGTLTLTVRNTMIDAEQARRHPPVAVGPFVVISVQDTGHGIPSTILERIFDPFFTTKEPGKGTGLGLSTVIGIVRSHGGFVEVESEVGRGATFRVFLPAAPTELPVPPSAMLTEPARGHDELILVVDDEPNIREATRVVLERQGYRVVIASRGDEALALFRLRGDEIKVALTDVMMPVMNGVTLIQEIRKLRPGTPIIVTTGMASDAKHAEIEQLSVAAVLAKPCGATELLEAVAAALSENLPSTADGEGSVAGR